MPHLMLIALPDRHALRVMEAGVPGGCVWATVKVSPHELSMPIDALTQQILCPLGDVVQNRLQEVKPH